MKKLLTIAILFFCLNNLFAQTIRDSVFNNVNLIKKTDVSTNGFHFLIDIPIKTQKDPIVIVNHDSRIPLELFFDRKSFLSEQNEIILIEDGLLRIETKETEKWAPSLKIYHIDRAKSKVDSLVYKWVDVNPVKLNFKETTLKENEVKYFFKECYGSTCCPEDPSWKFEKERNEIRDNFNRKYDVNIYKNVYRQIKGKEGEHCDYYTLSNLTNEQKIEFLFPPKTYTETDDVTQGFFVIILPSVINTENMKHINQ